MLDELDGKFPRDEKLNIPAETGVLYLDFQSSSPRDEALSKELGKLLVGKSVLGLVAKSAAPRSPNGPAIVCRVKLQGSDEKPEALVWVESSNPKGDEWAPAGKFTLPIVRDASGTIKAEDVATSIGEGLLSRLVRAQLMKPHRVNSRLVYEVRVDNASPLILNGIAISGSSASPNESPSVISGICVSPHRSTSLPATPEQVQKLGLKQGLRVVAVDLSGL